MRKTSTELLEQGIQAPSPAPDLIPAEHQPEVTLGLEQPMGALQKRHCGCGLLRNSMLRVSPSLVCGVAVASNIA